MSSRSSRRSRRPKKSRSATLESPICGFYSHSLSPAPKPAKKFKTSRKYKPRRMNKSKSPSTKKPKKSRSRTTSYVPYKPDTRLDLSAISLKLDTTTTTCRCNTPRTKKKSKKKYPQTPVHNITINRKKKTPKKFFRSFTTPKISLSTSKTESFYSDDDEFYMNEVSMKLSNSNSINRASKNLNFTNRNMTHKINTNFSEFHRALNAKQGKLLEQLEAFYNEKKQQLISIEKILFINAQNIKSKNMKQREFEFDTKVQFIMNTQKILAQISKYGYIQTQHTNNTNMKLVCNYESKSDSGTSSDDIESDTMAMRQKVILAEIQEKTMHKLDVVILMEAEAQKKAKQAAKLRREVAEGMRYITERSEVINDKISAAMGELEAAREAVAGLDPKAINEIKSLKSPPSVIENVITATVMILGHRIREWRDVQKLLSYKFKPELLNFDTYSLSPIIRQGVYDKYVGNEDFNYGRVYEGSKVCGNLVLWVISQINYSRLLDVIIPLQKEVKKLKKESSKKEKLAGELMENVAELEENIKLYTDECNKMIDHIIKSTDYELKQFGDKLQPLNEKFNRLLRNNVL